MDLSTYLTDSGHYSNVHCWWTYEFPCGRGAGVGLSKTPFLFDVEVDNEQGGMDVFTAQTTTQVLERLAVLAAMPAAEENA